MYSAKEKFNKPALRPPDARPLDEDPISKQKLLSK